MQSNNPKFILDAYNELITYYTPKEVVDIIKPEQTKCIIGNPPYNVTKLKMTPQMKEQSKEEEKKIIASKEEMDLLRGFMGKDFYEGLPRYIDWNILMPVVEKIEHCDDAKNDRGYSFHVCIFDKDCHIYEYMNDDEQPPIFMEEGKTKLEATWLAVVEFIKFWG